MENHRRNSPFATQQRRERTQLLRLLVDGYRPLQSFDQYPVAGAAAESHHRAAAAGFDQKHNFTLTFDDVDAGNSSLRTTSPSTVVSLTAVDFPRWWALSAFFLVLSTAAGNVLVCLAIYWEKRLQNVTNYFLMSLAITDLMVAILVMPMGILSLVQGKFLPTPYGNSRLQPAFCSRIGNQEKRLQNVTNYFLVFLAVADIMGRIAATSSCRLHWLTWQCCISYACR